MPLNGAILGALIRGNIDSAVAANTTAGAAQREAIFEAMGNAIVAHIITATVTVTVASVGAVTPGVGISGPGTGSAVIS